MAKTLFGALIVDMRNKLGGHVLSKNKGGSFIRRKVSPIQPFTAPQRLIRGILTQLARSWGGTLIDSERAAWKAFADAHPVTDVFGQNVKLTGEQMFVRLNTVSLFLGGVTATIPPASLVVAAITGFTVVASEATNTITLSVITPTPLAAEERYVAWATPQNGPGKNQLDSQFTYITKGATTAALIAAITAAYLAKYADLVAGQKIGVGLRVQNILTGASSPLVNQIITIGA